MNMNFRNIFLWFAGVFLLLSGVAQAQWEQKKPRFEAYAEASTIGGDFTGSHGPASGVRAGGTYNQKFWLGWVADAGHYEFSDTAFQSKVTTLMAGPRFSDHDGRVNYFVQSLFGGANVRTHSAAGYVPVTQFASAFGAGMDVSISPHVTFRLVEAEFLFTEAGSNSMNSSRISSGIVFRFGGQK
ncbi:MAG: hypothetical protein WB421_02580 [Terriglobales bacterium]|jgi:hypothetical protein